MDTSMDNAAKCLIEGAKAMKLAKKWKKFGDAFGFIKPIKKFAYQQAICESSFAEFEFKIADVFKRIAELEKTE